MYIYLEASEAWRFVKLEATRRNSVSESFKISTHRFYVDEYKINARKSNGSLGEQKMAEDYGATDCRKYAKFKQTVKIYLLILSWLFDLL